MFFFNKISLMMFLSFILVLLNFVMKMKKIVNMMILIEYFVLMMILAVFSVSKKMKTKFILMFLLLGVCEASVGLSFLILAVRKKIFFMKSVF